MSARVKHHNGARFLMLPGRNPGERRPAVRIPDGITNEEAAKLLDIYPAGHPDRAGLIRLALAWLAYGAR